MSFIPSQDSDIDLSPAWEVVCRSRSAIIDGLSQKPVCDVLIVGGGIAGATLARLAAFNGLRTVLLESGDYGSGTSSRTSKMAHGGLRYLEMFDFKQVLEGVRARDDLFATAPHLARSQEFLIPIPKSGLLSKCKYSVGLTLYDRLARSPVERRHSWIPAAKLQDTVLAPCQSRLLGAYRFYDGIMDDARLVIENVISARQEGATCLNYAEFVSFEISKDGSIRTGWRDLRSGQSHELTTGLVVNCAGPWAASLGRLTPYPELGRVRFSRGVHLVFNRPWNEAALLLSRAERGRNYFVWPHPAGTLVGTTDHPTENPERDPVPTSFEVQELLMLLQHDLPELGLSRDNLHYAYAGLRVLPVRSTRMGATSRISRRHRWVHTPGMLTLLGGKFTNAAAIACEGLSKIFKLSDVISPMATLQGRKFPGAIGLEEVSDSFRQSGRIAGVPVELIDAALRRFGSRVKYFSEFENPFEVIGGVVLRGEINLALQSEQVETLEDLMRRRLGLEYHPGGGLPALSELAKCLAENRSELGSPQEMEKYRSRLTRIKEIIEGAGGWDEGHARLR